MYYWDTYFDKKIDERLNEMERNGETLNKDLEEKYKWKK